MTLEDHAGDIVRKARAAAGVTEAAAATAAGLSGAELNTLEREGTSVKTPDWQALAKLLDLDANKLKNVAAGWVPSAPDLGAWREVRQIISDDGGMLVNCYLIWDEVSLEAALFDTGMDAAPIFKLLQENGLTLQHIFLTHLHHDHIGALDVIRNEHPRVHIHANSTTFPPQHRNRANDFIHLGSLRISNRQTPGHSEDGATYVVGNWPEDAPHVAFVGDAIFAGSMGRGNQSWTLARQKVREQILSLPPDTLLGPGHGPWTTVALEREHNPFF